jgi:alkyl hydroperoxide reductase subunit AhpC
MIANNYCFHAVVKQQAKFLADVNETQDVQVNFPIFADESGELTRSLGLVSPTAPANGAEHYRLPYSAAIIVDIDLVVRFIFYYPISIGRNLYEVIMIPSS